jgi:hypothetical protein
MGITLVQGYQRGSRFNTRSLSLNQPSFSSFHGRFAMGCLPGSKAKSATSWAGVDLGAGPGAGRCSAVTWTESPTRAAASG